MNKLSLENILKKSGIDNDTIQALSASGYSYMDALDHSYQSTQCIQDSFYGRKWFIGLIPIDMFLDHKRWGPIGRFNPPTYFISSIQDAQEILSRKRHAQFYEKGMTSFRGQTKEYFTKRLFPNPFMSNEKNEERLIIPSFWRKYNNNWSKRFKSTNDNYMSIFSSIYGDELIYYGIKDWKNLAMLNFERYGVHTMSDLEDFPDEESREYGKRWTKFKVNMGNPDLPLVEQHYGIETPCLDLTFDIIISIFFATHNFQINSDGKAYYRQIEKGHHKGVVYCFVFRDPSLTLTSDLVKKVPSFDHIPPQRPLKQKCALSCFDAFSINEAVTDIDAILYLDKNFDMHGIPNPEDIFPSIDEDPFYRAVINLKNAHPDLYPYNQFINYVY